MRALNPAHLLQQNVAFSLGLMLLLIWVVLISAISHNNRVLLLSEVQVKLRAVGLTSAMIGLPLLVAFALPLCNFLLKHTLGAAEIALPRAIALTHNLFYSGTAIFLLGIVYYRRHYYSFSMAHLKGLSYLTGLGAVLNAILQGIVVFHSALSLSTGLSVGNKLSVLERALRSHAIAFLPLFLLMIVAGGFRQFFKRQQFNDSVTSDKTTGHFGSARWMKTSALKTLDAYDPESGPFIGADEQGRALYLPLVNKLTIAPPGSGKTSSSSIPVLLSHDGPVFVFDIKGELWAVTARYRAEQFKRKVVVIDPYQVTQLPDFKQGKSDALLTRASFNPFDWIPEDLASRDRMINAFAASFIVEEGGFATHFDENAKILIRGYIDHIMRLAPASRSLAALYDLMSESVESAELTFDLMQEEGGRAGAAAQQIKRVGMDERGSILSTSYRQIDWIGDSNMQATLSTSTVDLREFIQGNMDIFVILPEDQVKEHSRLVRMLLVLLMGLFVQTNPSTLPKKKSLFLLEELAQLGYCPDVEQCVEVLRARGVVVWTVFQTLSQIEQFKKPDLFKGAALKQIFTNDDTKTMQWIQTLAGKKTVLTKTLNAHTGYSLQKTHAFKGTLSTGEGKSIHEAAADLIQLNEIREMPSSEQLVFLQGAQPIRCKKVRYFEHPAFEGKFDLNPLEKSDTVKS